MCEKPYILNKQTNKQTNIFVYISWAMQEGGGGPPEAGGWWCSGVMKLKPYILNKQTNKQTSLYI